MTHFLLTRMATGNPSADWLKHRLEQFRKYCLPSVAAQTNQNFRWLLAISDCVPDWFERQVRDEAPQARVIVVGEAEAWPRSDDTVVDFPSGYKLHHRAGTLAAIDLATPSHFASLLESGRRTVCCCSHSELGGQFVINNLNRRAWIEVVHGRNIANRFGGQACSQRWMQLSQEFGVATGQSIQPATDFH